MANSNVSTDKKLELVHSIRKAHEENLQTIGKREAILYGKPLSVSSVSAYPYEEKGADTAQVNTPDHHLKSPFSFKIRSAVAVLILICYIVLGNMPNVSFAPIKLQVKTYLNKDFTNNLVAYVEDFTYTFDYEKISAK